MNNRGPKPIDRVGLRYGKLIVIQCIEPSMSDANEGGKWLCLCDCGNTIQVKGIAFRHKRRNSCGCLRSESRIGKRSKKRAPSRVTVTAQYCTHRSKGIKRGLGYLSKEDWESIVFQPCHYCGEMDTRNNLLYSNYDAKSRFTEEEIREYDKKINGIDRIDNSIGYIFDNCRPCCAQCNTLKMDYTEQEFFNKISLINNRHSYRDVPLESLLCN